MPPIKVDVRSWGRKYWMLVWRDPVTGQQRTESSRCTRKRDAERKAIEKERDLNSVQPKGDGSIGWEQFVDEYTDNHLESLAPRSQTEALGILDIFERTMQPVTVAAVTSSVLSKYARRLRDDGLKEATIAKHLRTIRAAISWAVDTGHAAGIPAIPRITRAIANRSKGRPLTATEFARMLRHTSGVVGRKHGRSWRRLLRGLWLSGLRLSESLALSWDRNGELWIELESGPFPLLGIRAESEKGMQDRLMPLTPDFARWVLRTPPQQRCGFVFNPGKQRHREFRSLEHVSKTISEIGEAAGVTVNTSGKFASAHDLRRSFGLRWAQKVMPAVLQDLMRHENISTTMTYYAVQNAADLAAKLWQADATPDATPKQE